MVLVCDGSCKQGGGDGGDGGLVWKDWVYWYSGLTDGFLLIVRSYCPELVVKVDGVAFFFGFA